MRQPDPGVRVLVVDDSAVGRKAAEQILEILGYHAETLSGGTEAIQELQCRAFDAVLMDCQMPVMDGYQTSQSIRRNEVYRGKRVPIIAVSATDSPEVRAKCADAGMDDFLLKPLKVDPLKYVIEKCIGRDRRLKTVDGSALMTLRQVQARGERSLIRELAGLFFDSVPAGLGKIRKALEKGDFATIGREAHIMKSSSSNLGAFAMASMCVQLEKLGVIGSAEMIPGATAQLDELEREYARVKVELIRELRTLKTSF